MGKNEKTKKPKPKYNVWQNTAYMLSVAWDTRRSVPLLVVLLAPASTLLWAVAGSSLLFLALLGALSGRVGGAPMGAATLRVTFWGALAMALTAGVGALFGVAA